MARAVADEGLVLARAGAGADAAVIDVLLDRHGLGRHGLGMTWAV